MEINEFKKVVADLTTERPRSFCNCAIEEGTIYDVDSFKKAWSLLPGKDYEQIYYTHCRWQGPKRIKEENHGKILHSEPVEIWGFNIKPGLRYGNTINGLAMIWISDIAHNRIFWALMSEDNFRLRFLASKK